MAASAKRKQEEKHLKLLREMTSLPHNRKCFDCDQRGPTYANMTVGSFVCTSCSGILRGLNPPHRVKSISMTTFTQNEIEFLQKHGNEVCKQIWLGLFDDRSSTIPDFRDPQKVKEFLQEKYEKKRWYVPPDQAKVVASVHASISGSSASSTSSTPEVKPLKTLLGETAPALHLNKGTPTQSPVANRSHGQPQSKHEKKQFDLLSDLGTDIFAAPAPAPQSTVSTNFANFAHFNSHAAQNSANADFANFEAFGQSSGSSNFGGFPTANQSTFQPPNTAFRTLSSSCSFGDFTAAFSRQAMHRGTAASANANFAHFDNFPKSSSVDFGSFNSAQSSTSATTVSKVATNKPNLPAADKYAALADLDNIFSTGPVHCSIGQDLNQDSPATHPTGSFKEIEIQVSPCGSGQGGGFGTAVAASTGPTVSAPSQASSTTDNNIFRTVPVGASAQTHLASSATSQFAGTASTNPFMAVPGGPVAPIVNPFQSNGRTTTGIQDGHALGPVDLDYQNAQFHHFHHTRLPTAGAPMDATTFGTASMSMPAGFGAPASYNLPTSFSGNFHQPAFPAQAGFPQQTAFPQQQNGNLIHAGGGFAVFGQGKPVVTSFGQIAAPGLASNPFMGGGATGPFSAGGSSTNPFL
ncbi:arf-GAP domain and FG repeat-containing protein 1 isoform X3 [Ambystoma mexicanum]|uniref:arf-GAP domain and FG repeat-containing protein 1 isoform X3 n=1 Tax=Ambystoma mexicanum TaxID=8296 RepID=UPI0037E8EBF8